MSDKRTAESLATRVGSIEGGLGLVYDRLNTLEAEFDSFKKEADKHWLIMLEYEGILRKQVDEIKLQLQALAADVAEDGRRDRCNRLQDNKQFDARLAALESANKPAIPYDTSSSVVELCEHVDEQYPGLMQKLADNPTPKPVVLEDCPVCGGKTQIRTQESIKHSLHINGGDVELGCPYIYVPESMPDQNFADLWSVVCEYVRHHCEGVGDG